MAKLIYGSTVIDLRGQDPNSVLQSLRAYFPELANATLTQQGEDYVVTVATATKGADRLIYGSTVIDLANGLNADDALNALKAIYPELVNATVTENEDGDYVVTVATATKGARK